MRSLSGPATYQQLYIFTSTPFFPHKNKEGHQETDRMPVHQYSMHSTVQLLAIFCTGDCYSIFFNTPISLQLPNWDNIKMSLKHLSRAS